MSVHFRRIGLVRGLKPIAFLPGNKLLMANKTRLSLINTTNFSEEVLADFRASRHTVLSRLYRRLFRLDFRAAQLSKDGRLLLANRHALYLVDTNKLPLRLTRLQGKRHTPLYITKIEDVNGFENQLVFGEYFQNSQKDSVAIHQLSANNELKEIFRFQSGQINHLHSLVPDPWGDCVWGLAGDFGDGAAIFRFSSNFRKSEAVLRGEQRFRACAALPTKDGLFYCTDTHVGRNFLMFLSRSSKTSMIAEEVKKLPGPVIYSVPFKNGLLFSTALEPAPSQRQWLPAYLTRKPSPHIETNRVHVFFLDSDGSIQEITSDKKDCWPFLFQFATYSFPCNQSADNLTAFFRSATSLGDCSTEIWQAIDDAETNRLPALNSFISDLH